VLDTFHLDELRAVTAAFAGDRAFLGGEFGILFFKFGQPLQLLTPPRFFPQEKIGAIAVNGSVVEMMTASNVLRLRGSEWKNEANWGYPSAEIIRNELRNLDVDDQG